MKWFAVVAVTLGSVALWHFRAARTPVPQPAPVVPQPVIEPKPLAIVQEPAIPEPTKPYSPPPVHAHNLQALVNRNAHNRISSDIGARIPEAAPSDFPALLQVLQDSGDDDTVRNEVCNLLRRSKCPDVAQALTQVLDNPDEKARFRSFAMQHLGGVATEMDAGTRQPLVTKMEASLNDKHFQVRAQALQNLCRLKDEKGVKTAADWLEGGYKPCSPDAYVGDKPLDPEFERGEIIKQCIEQVHDAGLKEHIGTIRKLARDKNIVIARAAIVALADWHDMESLPVMKEAAAAKDPLLRSCGKAAMQRMTETASPQAEPVRPPNAAN